MKYFLDTEFIEYPGCIDLISIGIVAEDGREFYAISTEFDASMASEWVINNVLAKLPKRIWECRPLPGAQTGIRLVETFRPQEYLTRREIACSILGFVGDEKPEFWGYYADYDWVSFCWLFGTMMELPKGWPMYCRDFKQVLDSSVFKLALPKQESDEHNALADARHLKRCFDHFNKISRGSIA